ncbi:hypothetical protein Q2T83_03930 [Fervidibacter sacchari]|uniref:Uncharacterized protein n=1 Tax=Candidatus Fervidibacter sacchari TaxID=1448929 RepID=A0ABT2EQR9_9BACT|nr:hypothetical protein [Candidatus Fervidibacter sacchari]MCS3919781.1 hypothetical protein [Candidatus Fervidibacter sacchari]WKU16973.1 hypothetical protein Q2T83_03930 [Candidatus Fervidibacter sacchari]
MKLSQGKLTSIAYVAYLEAENFGIAGTVEPYPKMPYELPLFIKGVNCNWEAAVCSIDRCKESRLRRTTRWKRMLRHA